MKQRNYFINKNHFFPEDNKQSPDEKSKSSVRVSGEIDQHQSLQDGLQRNQYLSQNEPGIEQGRSDLQQGQQPMEQFQRADPQNEQEQLMKEQHQSQIQQHLDVEERNYMCITLLLYRVGLVKLRQFFINEWNSLGDFAPWTDCPQNGADLLRKFKPLSYEIPKVRSGDSRTWDISILIRVLLSSWPPLVSESDLVNSLKCLREIRNQICHTGSGRIESSEFTIMYDDVCSALMAFGASSKDFREVVEAVQQPWKDLSAIVKHFASQDEDILGGFYKVNEKLDQLHKKVDRVEKSQQELQKTVEEIKQSQSDQLQQKEAILQEQSGLREDIEELRKDQQKGQEKLLIEIKKRRHKLTKSISSNEDVELYSKNLKENLTSCKG
ncbi:uncharacterized protein LOC110248327 [Exaiptasia diaphana]|uniref:DZIP3-like HEPN domain-containing protein n=1 Tax=Exaiptasia diaphana TaxID=2652724 RepID=A0A913YRS5_EXADI|nr:uncharacterized protein LOC110248327 [Exaiptasia diaphana]